MPSRSKPSSRSPRGSKLLRTIRKHPVATAGIAGGAVLGAALVAKAANTAAKVVTIKAAGDAAADVTRAVGSTVRARAGTKRTAKRPAGGAKASRSRRAGGRARRRS